MLKRLWIRIKQWMKVPETAPPPNTQLTSITQNTISKLEADISYNKKVVILAACSLAIWFTLLLCYCFCTWKWETLFDIKIYPAPVWALITGAFTERERLEQKKKLNEFIKDHLKYKKGPLYNNLTDTAWDEYKNQ